MILFDWFGFIGYLMIGLCWAEFVAGEEYVWNKHKMEYHQYVYHGLFWPVSVIVYLIKRWK